MLRPLPLRFGFALLSLLLVVLGAHLTVGQSSHHLRVLVPNLKGDATLLLLPTGHTILIDGGADGAAVATWLGNTLPFGRRRIDAVVLSRADSNTLPGQLAAIKRYKIGMALLPPTDRRSSSLDAWWQLLEQQQAPIHVLTTNDQLAFGTCALHVLEEHEGRATFAFGCGTTVVYFLQAVDDDSEAALETGQYEQATLVIYPWQRPAPSSLLQAMRPIAIVFSEGSDDSDSQTWANRRVGNALLYHEAINGQIELIDNGQQARIVVEQGD